MSRTLPQSAGNEPLSNLDKIDRYGPDGKTLLLGACEDRQTKLIEALLFRDADPSCPDQKTSQTPLHIAAQQDNDSLIYLLLHSGAKIGALNQDKQTPARLAETLDRKRAVEAFAKWERGNRPRHGELTGACVIQ